MRIQELITSSANTFWDPIAESQLHWVHEERQAWLSRQREGQWAGWDVNAERILLEDDWTPWHTSCNESNGPVIRWFDDGKTNAAFNELDRHVLGTDLNPTAFISDAPSGAKEPTSLRDVLAESVLVAATLKDDHGLTSGQRIAFYLPNDYRAPVWIEAAKRLGAPYVAVASGTGASSLADRITNTGAIILATTAGLVQQAQKVQQLRFPLID